jgi:ferredoxin-like protein FixX
VTPESQSDECHVICPYCLSKYQAEAEDFSEYDREEECQSCGKIYILCDSMTVTHYTRPMANEKG